MIKLAGDRNVKGKELRMVVVDTIQDLMNSDDKVVALEADLGGASGFTKMLKEHADRFVQCGIAEANMVGVACGLSLEGFKPYLHTFGPFATRRVYDQVFLSGAYAHNTLNIYGSDPGFTVGPNGGTHTTWEDMALMTAIPNAIVCDGADEVELEFIVREFSKMDGIHYFRANRKNVRNIYDPASTFELGKANVLKEGNDVLIIACGQIVSDALDCAESLEKQGLNCTVIDMFTIKPIDKEALLKYIPNKKAVVTFENHSIHGGLGSAVSEVIAENGLSCNFKRLGVNEKFGQVGSPDFLQKEFGLTATDLENAIKEMLK